MLAYLLSKFVAVDNYRIMETELNRAYIIKRRNAIIWELSLEGFTCGDISAMMNGLDRTWISRIVKVMKTKISKRR